MTTAKTTAKKTARKAKPETAPVAHARITRLPIRQIHALPQVRTEFEPEGIAQLAESLQAHGLLQPILVREAEGTTLGNADGSTVPLYYVIAGQRRLAAAQQINWTDIDCIIRTASDEDAAVQQLIENIQREELSLADTAAGILQLYERHKALAPVAQIVNKSLSWVSKHLSAATKLSYRAKQLLDEGCEDLETLLTVTQIEPLPGAWPRIDNLADKIAQGKAGRKEARALLEELRKEGEEKKAAKKAAKQEQLQLQTDKDAEGAKRTEEPAFDEEEALWSLARTVCEDPKHAEIEQLLAGYNKKQLAAMNDSLTDPVGDLLEAHKQGKEDNARPVAIRALARRMALHQVQTDPFVLAAYLLGYWDQTITVQNVLTELHHVHHA